MRCSAGNCSASAEFFSSSESATKMREQIADECMNEEPWGESCRKIPEDTSFFFGGGGEFVHSLQSKILHNWNFFLSVKKNYVFVHSWCIIYIVWFCSLKVLPSWKQMEQVARSFLDTPSEKFDADFRQLMTFFVEDLKILFGIRYWLTRPTLIIHVESVSSRNYAEAIAWLRMHKNVSCWQLVALVTVGANTES